MYLGAITLLTNCSYTIYKNNQAATTLTIDPKLLIRFQPAYASTADQFYHSNKK